MKLFKHLWDWLTKRPKRSSKKGHPDLYPIDVAELAEELALREGAKRLGEAGLPAADTQRISGPEAEAVQRIEKIKQDYVDWAMLRLKVLGESLGEKDVEKAVNRACQADEEFKRKAEMRISEQHGLLRRLSDTATKRDKELTAFKQEHALMRDAHYPSGGASFFQYSLLILLVVIEGLLNANFFSQGLNSGLLGGFLHAIILAAVNVAVAFSLGKWAIRYAFCRSIPLKIIGLFAITTALFAMTLIALGIAHFRDALTAEAANPASVALQTLTTSPFSLHDISSWVLFAISIGFALASLVDGLCTDDRYPGYGAITRRAEMAADDFEAELADLREELDALKDDELEDLDIVLERSQSALVEIERLIKDKQTATGRLSSALDNADNSLVALIRIFQDENELNRKGIPTPAYFGKPVETATLEIPTYDSDEDDQYLVKQQQLVQKLLQNIDSIRANIQAAFNYEFDQLKALDIHFAAKENA